MEEKTEFGASSPHRTLTRPPRADSLACCNNDASALVSSVDVRVLSQGASSTESLGQPVRRIQYNAPLVVCATDTFAAGK